MDKTVMASILLFMSLAAYGNEAEKYHGMVFSDWESPTEYKYLGGGCIGREMGLSEANNCAFSISDAEITTRATKKIKVLFLQSNTGEKKTVTSPFNGKLTDSPIWKIEDSIELSPKEEHLDTELCVSSEYPNTKIVCSGKWNWRKKPSGWGYMKPIKKAWRIDIDNKKFIEIDTKNVKCELNEDRN
ncbi:MAG: hypothetical protein PHW18_10105 [Sulfuricurvum sp.]|uniref:hypothetical protein n=1 Tax=Sulfuricurvum sp. TaxID=2025608 RepID=UPI0026054878|nr:hypothetical protein [Sulfuricurvum sp.]MDD2829914.1 hypothetical protein [Sulfuricurvum sp.]MDD4949596.1 hypothetical protein [Sulfuricurvum sp.]